MAAAAKISSYLTYIYDLLGTQAHFVLLGSSLIQENSNLNSFCKTQLVNDAIKVFSGHAVKIQIRLAQGTENGLSIKECNAFKERSSHDLVLHISLFIEAVIDDTSKVNTLFHEKTGDLHGPCRSAGIFEHTGIMYQSCIQAFCCVFINAVRI